MAGPIEIKSESHVEPRSWDGSAGWVGGVLRMPAISNTIRQMDQRAAGLHRAKSSRSRDRWISVNPTEKGEEVRANLATCFLITSLSLSLCHLCP